MKSLSILGSTGSIGVTTLDVVGRFRDRFRVVALAAGRNVDRLAEQVRAFEPAMVATGDEAGAEALRAAVPDYRGEILTGIDGIAFHYLNETDVIRHRLVREIIKAYAEDGGD